MWSFIVIPYLSHKASSTRNEDTFAGEKCGNLWLMVSYDAQTGVHVDGVSVAAIFIFDCLHFQWRPRDFLSCFLMQVSAAKWGMNVGQAHWSLPCCQQTGRFEDQDQM